MEEGSPMWHLMIIGISVLIHGILYGFGAASQELNESEIEKRAEEGEKRSQKLFKIINSPAKYVNTIQMCITFISMTIGVLEVPSVSAIAFGHCSEVEWFAKLGQELGYGLIAVLTLFLFMSVFVCLGILVPKKLAVKYPQRWAYSLLPIAKFLMVICTPLGAVISAAANGIVRIFGVDPKDSEDDVTEEEIISMVMEGHEQGVLEASEAEMIHNIFQLGDKDAKDIMTHRKNIRAVDQNMSLSQVLDFMLEGINSRYPVYDEEIDNVIGILYLRDVIEKIHREKSLLNVPIGQIKGLIREAVFVPETKDIDELFRTMQSEKIQMVIVVDEYGQTSGLIAMEDILEEIVGNIFDEYDEEERYITEEKDGSYQMEGLTPLEEVEEKLGLTFEDVEFETLNGLLISILERIPGEDETPQVIYQGYEFKILSVENNIISSVEVTKLPELEPEEEEESE